MRIELTTVATIGKSVSIKREKVNDVEQVVAHLKFDGAFIDREQFDEICGQPIGWSQLAFFNELGGPVGWIDLKLPKTSLTITGRISGVDGGAHITLTDAILDGIQISLAEKGALMSGSLAWCVAGDEASELEPLLARICRLGCVIHDSGQADLLKAVPQQAHGERQILPRVAA